MLQVEDESPDLEAQRFGENVKALRKRAGMSQADLAKRMAERGWPWHQNTVYRIENGGQAVRLFEAAAVAAVLQTSIDRLLWPTPEASATEHVTAAGTKVRTQYEAVAEAVQRMLLDVRYAERALAETKGNTSERVQEARRDTAGRLTEYGVQQAIDEGVRRYAELTGDTEQEDGDGSCG